mmetsp:Transcript_5169/g.11712  ORF Transcript_5169/g.11712 Transcript_5169/m.11712 type:complete len:98 (-) Transcript_5169:40-333(-)
MMRKGSRSDDNCRTSQCALEGIDRPLTLTLIGDALELEDDDDAKKYHVYPQPLKIRALTTPHVPNDQRLTSLFARTAARRFAITCHYLPICHHRDHR